MAVILNVFLGKSRGGIEVVTTDYAKAFASLGHQSYLLSANGRDYVDYLKQSGLPLKLLAGRNINPFTLLQFIFFLKKLKPDVVFLHATRAVSVGTSWYISKLFPKVKFIGISHGVADRRYKKLKYAVAITDSLSRRFKRWHIPHIYSCPNMTVIKPFREQAPRHTPIVIGSMGRLSPSKGFDILIAAANILKEKGIDFKLKLAGFSAEDCKSLINTAKIADNLEIAGWITDKEAFYDRIDIYVSASRVESFGLTIIEAMAHSVPVIASDTVGAGNIISSGTDGFLVPRKKTKKLAEAIYNLSTANEETFTAIRTAGYNKAKEKYNLAKLPEVLNTILADILTVKA
ncbi:MAG: glycosyltransferase family 4 protein [Alphaproteobacteria bacterium]|nr:glycosyltransferase family 4 protein [Alphaproteobacteria bacterium]